MVCIIQKKTDNGLLSDGLIEFINNYKKLDKNLPQFLITHTEDLTRLIFRLQEKNIPKTKKIQNFLKQYVKYEKEPHWLLNIEFIEKSINKYTEDLGNKLLEIYKNGKSIEKVDEFLSGVRVDRLELDFDKCCDNGKVLIYNIFNKLIIELGKDNINKLDNTNKLYKLFKFLADKYILN